MVVDVGTTDVRARIVGIPERIDEGVILTLIESLGPGLRG